MAAVDLRMDLPGDADGADTKHDGEAWLDLCAGPGGKAALLGALASQGGATLLANEPAPHRAKLVSQALSAVPRETWQVRTGDGREWAPKSQSRLTASWSTSPAVAWAHFGGGRSPAGAAHPRTWPTSARSSVNCSPPRWLLSARVAWWPT